MLPFLKDRKVATMILMKKADGSQDSHEEGEQPEELMMAAEELLRAIASKDAKAVSEALRSAVHYCQGEEE